MIEYIATYYQIPRILVILGIITGTMQIVRWLGEYLADQHPINN